MADSARTGEGSRSEVNELQAQVREQTGSDPNSAKAGACPVQQPTSIPGDVLPAVWTQHFDLVSEELTTTIQNNT